MVFTRVGSVKGSPAITGDTGYLEVGTVSSVVELYWPGIADRVMWQLTEARISSSHLNNC